MSPKSNKKKRNEESNGDQAKEELQSFSRSMGALENLLKRYPYGGQKRKDELID